MTSHSHFQEQRTRSNHQYKHISTEIGEKHENQTHNVLEFHFQLHITKDSETISKALKCHIAT